MEILVVATLATAFILAVLEQLVDLRQFKAAVSVGCSMGILLSYDLRGADVFWKALACAFAASFMVALADRLVAVPLTISRAVGNLR